MPSAPTEVVTTGRPYDIAADTLPFTPAPTRSGQANTLVVSNTSRRSGTMPVTMMSSAASARTSSVGWAPAMMKRMPGSLARISGNTSRTKNRTASTLGAWP